MKKLIFSSLCLALLASCGVKDKNAYTLIGTLEGVDVANDTKVYLQTINENFKTYTIIDSATVQNGTFAFSGSQAEPAVRFIQIANPLNKKNPFYSFIIEPGAIQISIGEASKIEGTLTNIHFQTFKDNLNRLGDKMEDLEKRFGELTDVEAKKINIEETKKAEKEYADNIVAYAKENINSELGLYVFATNAYMLELEQTKEVLSLLPAASKGNVKVKGIENNLEALEKTKVGNQFLDIKGLSPEGKEVALSDYAGKGKIVLIDFWASWCPPCRRDMPYLVEAYQKYKSKGFEIVGVTIDSDKAAWEKGIETLGITWPQFSDLKGWNSDLSKVYGVSSIPHAILVDKEGKIIGKKIKGGELDTLLSELLNK